MRKKKQILKIGILLFGISIFLINCEKETFVMQTQTTETIEMNDFKVENLTFNQAISDPDFSKLISHFDIEKPKFSTLKGKYYSSVQTNSIESSSTDNLDMTKVVKITATDYTTYTMRVVEPDNTTDSFSNIVIKQSNEVEEIFKIKYTPTQEWTENQTESYTGDIQIESKCMYITENGSFDCDDGGNNYNPGDDFIEICYDVTVLVAIPCGCGHAPNTCSGSTCGPPTFGYYDIVTEQECYWTYVGSNPSTPSTGSNPNNIGGSSSIATSPISDAPSSAEVVIDCLFTANNTMNPETIDWINDENNEQAVQEIDEFLTSNFCSPEASQFAIAATEALMNNNNVNFQQFQVTQFINNIENPNTGSGVELYQMAIYNSNQLLDISLYSVVANEIEVGDYYLKPHYGVGNQLVFYAAYRVDNTGNPLVGIETIIRADALNDFTENVEHYTTAANLFYFNGIPSYAQVQMCAGDYWPGLLNMWDDALHSPEWWMYAITSVGIAVVNLPVNTPINSYATTPNWRVSLRNMTAETFQGKIVTNSQTGINVTISIPENYIPSIANNGQGLNFRPNPAIGTAADAGLIRVSTPTVQYPNGYAKFYNEYGQPMNNPSINTNPGSNANTHFGFN